MAKRFTALLLEPVLKFKTLPELKGRQRPYIIAHRGNKVRCPENTMASFRQALLDGADILETDLHINRDNRFVCIHDGTVDRTTDGSGPVAKLSSEQLACLSAYNGNPHFCGEKVPFLEELLEILPDDVGLALELKSDRFLEEDAAKNLYTLLKKYGAHKRTILLSFSVKRLQAMQQFVPQLPQGLITLSRLRPFKGTQLIGPFWPILLLNPFYMWAANRRNQAVAPLDTNPDSRLWLYTRMGCMAVLTDDPASTFEAMKKYRK